MTFYQDLTRFEKTRIISARALQLSMGAPLLIKTSVINTKAIALEEFNKGVLPITITRTLPKKR